MYAPCRARCDNQQPAISDNQQQSPVITWARIRQVLTPREVKYFLTSLPVYQRLTGQTLLIAGEYTPGFDPRFSLAGYKL